MRTPFLILTAALALGTMPPAAMAQSSGKVIAKVGSSCPHGFSSSGSSKCVSNGSTVAIVKVGSSCPSGFSTSGSNYCVSKKSGAKAIVKSGSSCPSGMKSSGSRYCVK
jgi:hypothetical protein